MWGVVFYRFFAFAQNDCWCRVRKGFFYRFFAFAQNDGLGGWFGLRGSGGIQGKRARRA